MWNYHAKQLYYKVCRLWRRLCGRLEADELVVIGDFGKFEVDKNTCTRMKQELGRLMGDAMVGHLYDECEKRGCKKLDAADN